MNSHHKHTDKPEGLELAYFFEFYPAEQEDADDVGSLGVIIRFGKCGIRLPPEKCEQGVERMRLALQRKGCFGMRGTVFPVTPEYYQSAFEVSDESKGETDGN